VQIDNGSALLSALRTAHADDQILLAGGDYGRLKLQDIQIDGQVTITSADPGHPAMFQYLSISNSHGLTFSGLEIDVRPGSLGIGVGRSSDIRFENMNVHGTVDGEYTRDGDGMTVRNSTNVTVANSTFHDLGSGITHIEGDGLVLSGNSFHDIRSDGIHGTRSSDVTIADNTFTDFHPYGADHPDAIQFWTNGDVPASNITITGNTITRGDGGKIQGIFLGDESGAGYKDVTITDNAVIGGMYHGIRLVNGDGAVVSDNLVVGYKDMTSWIQVKDSSHFVAEDNQATSFIIDNYDLLGHGNEFLQQTVIGDLSALTDWLGADGRPPAVDPAPPPAPVEPSAPAPMNPALPGMPALDTSPLHIPDIHVTAPNMWNPAYGIGWIL
jgi:hypothetical protein